ncbi:hypothetical protein RRSWK_02638 [Rhodopirellula sp. SWK7]|nr:hypothetical protein RRSWK_02638 [Rhodopirellula sp. SWK7]
MPVIEKQIEDTLRELRAWGSEEPGNQNPFLETNRPVRKEDSKQTANPNPRMNEIDLRQLVLRLYDKIEALETRVKMLEAQVQQ